MSDKQEIKKQARLDFAQYQKQKKEKRQEIKTLTAEQQKAEKNKLKQAEKDKRAARKSERKQLNKEERKLAKTYDKTYNKLRNRPTRRGILAAILVIVIFAGASLAPYAVDISRLTRTVDGVTTQTSAALQARENGAQIAQEISDEGIVLLKNEDRSLPLSDAKVNVFGIASTDIRYGGGGSGGADQSSAINLYEGLKNAGIAYNEELYQLLISHESHQPQKQKNGLMQIVDMVLGNIETDEPPADYLTQEVLNGAKDFSNNAVVVIASEAVELTDFQPEELKITPNKRALLDKVTQHCDNVIIVVNAGNALELGFIEEYPQIKSVVWVGTPGPFGMNSLGNMLAGTVNPSGRLTDTYAYDVTSNPASVNFGDYQYDNIKNMAFINYQEGIYVGYRFYETYYAQDEQGYQNAVQFPFGYGLSYTDFKWDVQEPMIQNGAVQVDVTVTNTGELAGKDVVQLYFSPPYTDGGIEKSAIELAAYGKTTLLNPGESETLTLSFAERDMASYDMQVEQAYMLEKGIYELKVARNVHEIISVFSHTVTDTVVYKQDEITGTAVENQFAYANGGLQYLSRDDWEATYPDHRNLDYTASQDLLYAIAEKPAKAEGDLPVMGAENGMTLADMKGLAYDDPKWEVFLDQFTIEEMKNLVVHGAYKTEGVERLGVPGTLLLDGPAGLNFFFGNVTAASYPTEVVIASTWNDQLARRMGEAIGTEANAYGVQGWYAPGMNIHRTPQGGRNFEYFSEDPLISGKMSAAMIDGAQSKDILVFMKHFAMNEQETNARSGVMVWANEQAIREIYLRPFEITVKEGHVTGAMSSFIHIGHKWSGGNPELLQNVLRAEWGFVGTVTTDAVLGKFMDLNLAIRNGNELMLDVIPHKNEKYFDRLYKEDPVGITIGLRERTHNIMYSILQTNAASSVGSK